MADENSKRLDEALKYAREKTEEFRHYSTDTEHLLLGLVIEKHGIAGKVLREIPLTEEMIQSEIDHILNHGLKQSDHFPKESIHEYSPRANQALIYAREEANKRGSEKVGTEHLLLALLRDNQTIASQIMKNLNVNKGKIRKSIIKKAGMDKFRRRRLSQPGKEHENKKSLTPTLDSVTRDLTKEAREGQIDPIIGREEEIKRITQILSRRTKNNPILVGEPGVGKTAVAEGIAQKMIEGELSGKLQNKRLLSLNLNSVVAGTKYRGQFEERMEKIIKEIIESKNIILFIDEIHKLVGAGAAEGSIDASNVLKPYLARGEIQTIGATTFEEYRKYIEADGAIERRFAKVTIDSPTEEETIEILNGLKKLYENHHKVKYSDEAIQAAVDLSVRYLPDRHLPDKAIDLIDEAGSKIQTFKEEKPEDIIADDYLKMLDYYAKSDELFIQGDLEKAKEFSKKSSEMFDNIENTLMNHKQAKKANASSKVVKAKDISEVVSQWTGIPVHDLEESESEKLIDLENILHERIIGQENAVSAVSRAIRRSRSGIGDPERPIGSFMFLGPTGVGKTELAKTIAEILFGSEEDLIRVDMSEYMDKYSTSSLIGAPPGYVGYEEAGQLTKEVRKKPYSVILFDEIEKAHPDVLNILLQVLDDGHLTDGQGKKVNFKNTIIIMSSNLGATALRDEKTVGFGAQKFEVDYEQMSSRIEEEMKKYFRPEFLNRIDESIIFHSLNKEQVQEVTRLLTSELVDRLAQQNIDLKITPTAIDILVENGFNPDYGARPLRRTIQNHVEDLLSDEIISGNLKAGDKITVGSSQGKIVLRSHQKKKSTVKNS